MGVLLLVTVPAVPDLRVAAAVGGAQAPVAPVGSFILTKSVVAPGAGPATDTFVVTNPHGAESSLGDGQSIGSELPAGSYTVGESVPPGWTASITCSVVEFDGTVVTIAGPQSVSFTVGDGAAVDCTLTNTRSASVTVVNSASPDESTSFGFDGPDGPFTLVDDARRTFSGLSPGRVVLTRLPVDDWALSSVECVDANGGGTSVMSIDGSTITVDVIAGDEIVCTFTTIETEIINPAVVEADPEPAPSSAPVAPTPELQEPETQEPQTRETEPERDPDEPEPREQPAEEPDEQSGPEEESEPGDDTEVAGARLLRLDSTVHLGSVSVDVTDVCEGQDLPTLWIDGEQVPATLVGDDLRMDGLADHPGEVSVAVRCGTGPIVAEGTTLIGTAAGGAGGSTATVLIVVLILLAVSGVAVTPGLLARRGGREVVEDRGQPG